MSFYELNSRLRRIRHVAWQRRWSTAAILTLFTCHFIQWERSWSEDPLDDSWADTTRDNRPRNVPGRRVDPIRGPRDAYLRPMIDSIGIRQRFAFKSQVLVDLCWRCCVLVKTIPGLGLTGDWLQPVLQLELSLISPLLTSALLGSQLLEHCVPTLTTL